MAAKTVIPIEDLNRVVTVTVQDIKGGYRYFAHLSDGSKVLLRQKATRRYGYAFMFDRHVASGADGWAAHFLYSGKPATQKDFYGTVSIKAFAVAEEDAWREELGAAKGFEDIEKVVLREVKS